MHEIEHEGPLDPTEIAEEVDAAMVEQACADEMIASPQTSEALGVDGAEDAAPGKKEPGFEDLGLPDIILKAVRGLHYTTPTPVQAASIPSVLAKRDILAAAQTGTGKTAAFLLPAMSNLGHVVHQGRSRRSAEGRGPKMLIITPTRELAQQIDSVCTQIATRTKHIAVTVVGGVGYNPQKSALRRGCDILVATPGRLIDLIDQGVCNLSEVEILVIDEADRMLDMGFLPSVKQIVALTPPERQTLLFSATLDEKTLGSIRDLVRDPVRVEIAAATSTADTVDQFVLPVSFDSKNDVLVEVLKREGASRVIVFMRTKHRADSCCRRLTHAGISAAAIHGDRSQAQRERALKAFRDGRSDVLVATDVIARGIDISDVRYVVNFDVPGEPIDYIHRIGRTGRAGEVGWALTFVTRQDIDEFYDIESLMGKTAEIYDAQGIDVGGNAPVIDPERVPLARGGRRRTKRSRSRSGAKTQRSRRGSSEESRPRRRSESAGKAASVGEHRESAQPRPSRPKRPGRARVRSGAADGDAAARSSRSDRSPRSDRSRTRREGARGGDAGRSRRAERPSRDHDWRNRDLPEERTRRGGRSGGGGRTDTGGSPRGRSGGASRRPGDGGGRR
ncbi:DEAD/DEAH box helicase domain protein [Coriobacterium glomerans PW2]|uniref:DEAD/DEAH box helicase domain protein n=1 Tax=Coriobacterium glomerans (strain ATCC 49209 / DSM 20642 / JCM 10262 / PW2) TaxID=700015 RepID=F2NBJ8_CORGP|nr:DEAD/DEAH box helicase [Coriobacterium glomerans]AEB06734.1 DEAD/DEAH box helicase domain protein [Coriobacterium glomerans PW2]